MDTFEFLITADIHFDLFENISLKNERLLTPRIEEIGQAVRQMGLYAKAHNITEILVAGDLFHRRNIRPDSVNQFVWETVDSLEHTGIKVHAVVGNHDQANTSGTVTALDTLSCCVYPKLSIHPIGGFEFHFLPYEEHCGTAKSIKRLLAQSANPNRILVAHAGIAGAKYSGFDHASRDPLELKDLHLDQYIYVYLGHYHEPQELALNAMYVGALVQHSFKDCGSKRGFWHVKLCLEGRKWKATNTFIPSKSPEFHQLTYAEYKNSNFTEKVYLKLLDIDRVAKDKIKDDPRIVGTTREMIETTEGKSLDLESTWEQQVEVYVDMECSDKKKRTTLKKLGKEFV